VVRELTLRPLNPPLKWAVAFMNRCHSAFNEASNNGIVIHEIFSWNGFASDYCETGDIRSYAGGA
jgi:hypothetical protein